MQCVLPDAEPIRVLRERNAPRGAGAGVPVVDAYQTDKEMVIHTLEGDMRASVGDYIITGVNGEQYPCKPDIFEKTYEPAE